MSAKLATATIPSGVSLRFRFIQIVLIPKLAAPLISLLKESPICTISCGFTGLRLGEVAGLTWQDINFEEQCLTARRSIRYSSATHKHEISFGCLREDGSLELPATVETACRTAARKVRAVSR